MNTGLGFFWTLLGVLFIIFDSRTDGLIMIALGQIHFLHSRR